MGSYVKALQSAGSVRFEQFGQDRCGGVIRRARSGAGPTHTQNWESRSHRPRAMFVCVGVAVTESLVFDILIVPIFCCESFLMF